MASRVTIRSDQTKQLAAAVARATVRALNRAIGTVRTDVTRKLAAETGVRQKTIRERLAIQRATTGKLEATLTVTAKPVPLIEYRAKQGPEGVTSGPRSARRLLRGSFLATMRSGHRGVYSRKGKSRSRRGKPRGSPGLPIFERVGPPLPVVATRTKILQSAVAVGEAAFQARLRHELGRALGGGS